MASSKPVEWVNCLITRFEEQLPCRTGPQTQHSRNNVEQNKEYLIHISKYKFSIVLSGLIKMLQKINERQHLAEMDKNFYDSILIVLDTIEKCLSCQPKEISSFDDTLNFKYLLWEICHFLGLPYENPMIVQVKNLCSKVLFALSLSNFSTVFSRISSRLQELSTTSAEENPDYIEIELIQHINVDVERLIKLLNETFGKFRCLRKNAQIILIHSLEKAVWNWMDTKSVIMKNWPNAVNRCFEQLESFGENVKRRAVAWPLQIMLLVLCPKVLEEVVNADTGAPCSQKHSKKKHFIDQLKKALMTHNAGKHLTEVAAVTCVKLCKIATYININDSNNVVFTIVQSVLNDLKLFDGVKYIVYKFGTQFIGIVDLINVLLFNPVKPFSRGQSYVYQDMDLMIDCFVSLFRINPHNNEVLKVCLNPNSPPIYHYVLVNSLFRIITQTRLSWWPQIDIVYNKSCELRAMFTDTLNKVTQGCLSHSSTKVIQSLTLKDRVGLSTKFKEKSLEEAPYYKNLLWMVRLIHADPILMLSNQGKAGHEVQSSTLELINGLVSLVHNHSMPDVAAEAMDALLVLHEPDKIEMWNPESPINTFWDVSSQVLFSISQKLIQHQIVNYTEILKWLRDILVCRNAFILRHKDYNHCNAGAQLAVCKQAHIKLEVVFLMYLWSIDMEAVLVAMSCFALLCEEADIKCLSDDNPNKAVEMLPNYSVCQELAAASTIMTTGRAALQKRIMALLRKIENWTQGCIMAWEDTFINWDNLTKMLTSYPKSRLEEGQISDTFHRSVGKRRASHQSSEHDIEIQDQVNEWANMTGFLCALGGVSLLGRTPSKNLTGTDIRKAIIAITSQDNQYCPVTQFLGNLLKLLMSVNDRFGAQMQKHVKELVGHEMSPLLYPIFFEQVKLVIDKFFDQQGQVRASLRHYCKDCSYKDKIMPTRGGNDAEKG
ncbi:Neurofibromin [Armadillidium nasatum]|uniref:Neurofibromin n=1 Tax=Armadillidium nasatum TaxID=96803 RepID=A0A5N5SJG9_9CRUS|nr:Neurofibromin [Armadillidium nasatum]